MANDRYIILWKSHGMYNILYAIDFFSVTDVLVQTFNQKEAEKKTKTKTSFCQFYHHSKGTFSDCIIKTF